ncbi:hypothetical protein [Nocardioides bigeumensis]|uniref:Uncharacterized protein n=1 Tax=Nocardioides bigeumensis TaxID=433657 RepID=A0ABN2Y0J9_9ACTN
MPRSPAPAILLVAALGAATPAAAAPADTVIAVDDAKNDVRTVRTQGLTGKQRASIDLRTVKVASTAESTTFKVTLKDVLPGATFDQMVFIDLLPANGSDETWRGSIGFSAQLPKLAYAYLDDPVAEKSAACDPLRSVTLGGQEAIRLAVPAKCLPETATRIVVRTISGHFRSDAGTWTKDKLRIPGAHVLR